MPLYVQKGDMVTVKASSGGITIAAMMRAKASGKYGRHHSGRAPHRPGIDNGSKSSGQDTGISTGNQMTYTAVFLALLLQQAPADRSRLLPGRSSSLRIVVLRYRAESLLVS